MGLFRSVFSISKYFHVLPSVNVKGFARLFLSTFLVKNEYLKLKQKMYLYPAYQFLFTTYFHKSLIPSATYFFAPGEKIKNKFERKIVQNVV